jgi:hypothetical protein
VINSMKRGQAGQITALSFRLCLPGNAKTLISAARRMAAFHPKRVLQGNRLYGRTRRAGGATALKCRCRNRSEALCSGTPPARSVASLPMRRWGAFGPISARFSSASSSTRRCRCCRSSFSSCFAQRCHAHAPARRDAGSTARPLRSLDNDLGPGQSVEPARDLV